MSASKCNACGNDVPEGARFCPSCGAAIGPGNGGGGSEASRVPVVCRNCGSENDPDAQFCESCGNRLSGAPRKEQAAQPPPKKRGTAGIRRRKIEAWHIAVVLSIITVVLIVLYIHERNVTKEFFKPPSGPTPENVNAVINELEDAAKLNPDDPAARLRLANALDDAKRFPQAISEYKKYLEIRPRDVDARVDMGICYFETGDSKSAMTAMDEGLKINPKHQLAMFNLGIVNLQARNIEEARSWFDKVIAIDSTTDVAKRSKMMIQQHSF